MKLTLEEWAAFQKATEVPDSPVNHRSLEDWFPGFKKYFVNVDWLDGIDPSDIPSKKNVEWEEECKNGLFNWSVWAPPNPRLYAERARAFLRSLTPRFVFKRAPDEDGWLIVFDGKEARFKHLAGMELIHMLLEQEGKDVSCNAMLAQAQNEKAPLNLPSAEQAQELLTEFGGAYQEKLEAALKPLDRRTIEARLAELKEGYESEENPEKKTAMQEGIRFIEKYLKDNAPTGPFKRNLSSKTESNRKAVWQNIETAKKKIRTLLPKAAAYLEESIKTGGYCRYTPDPQGNIRWILK